MCDLSIVYLEFMGYAFRPQTCLSQDSFLRRLRARLHVSLPSFLWSKMVPYNPTLGRTSGLLLK